MPLVSIFRHRLLLDIGQVGFATTVANFLFYLFQLAAGRGLGPQDYSLFGALFGIFYLASALATGLQVMVARFVAGTPSGTMGKDVGPVVTSALLRASLVGGSLFLVLSLMAPATAAYLHSNSTIPILLTGLAIPLFFVTPVTQGALQGSQKFHLFVALMLVYAGSRLVFGLGALGMSSGVTGILTALCLANLLAAVLGLFVIRPPLQWPLPPFPEGGFLQALLPAVMGTMAISFPGSVDLFLVRHFFPPQEAGWYAGVSILGKMVLFMPVAITTVLFPRFAQSWARGGSARDLLYKGLGLTALVSGGVSLGFALLPGLALSLLLGEEYAGAMSFVPLYVLAMFLFSLTVVFIYYHLATARSTYFYLLLLPHFLSAVALVYVWHASVMQVLAVLLGVNASLLASSLAFTQLQAPTGRRNKQAIVGV